VAPATHAGGPENTVPDAPPYGVRFRLKSDFDDSSFSDPQKGCCCPTVASASAIHDGLLLTTR
jgi:hypothetical protein